MSGKAFESEVDTTGGMIELEVTDKLLSVATRTLGSVTVTVNVEESVSNRAGAGFEEVVKGLLDPGCVEEVVKMRVVAANEDCEPPSNSQQSNQLDRPFKQTTDQSTSIKIFLCPRH